MEIESQLRDLGYDIVATADSHDDALNSVAALKPDLVLMDIRINGALDGIDAAEAIFRQHRIPVVCLTAN